MLDLLTAFARLLGSFFDFFDYVTATGSRLAQAVAVLVVAVGVGVTLWSLLRRRPTRAKRRPPRRPGG